MQNKIETTICSNCGAEVHKNKFCSQCGYKLDNSCIKCGSQLVANAKFCFKCGNKVGTNDNNVANNINNSAVDTINNKIKESEFNNAKVIKNTAEMQDEDFLAFKLFRIHAESFGKAGITAWNELVSRINSNWSENQYIKELEMHARENSDIAIQGINYNLLQSAASKIRGMLRKNEEIILYKDNSVFTQGGQVGHIITNKRLYILKKRQVEYLDYELMYSMHSIMGGSWYFNNNVDIDNVGCTNEELGIMLGLMCTYAKNCHKTGYKINVY